MAAPTTSPTAQPERAFAAPGGIVRPRHPPPTGGRTPPVVALPPIVQGIWWLSRPTGFYSWCRRRYGHYFVMTIPGEGRLWTMTEPEVVKAILTGDPEVLRAGEGNKLGDVLEPLLGDYSVLLLDEPEHMRQRKLMLPAFHGKRMGAYERIIADATQRSLEQWPRGEPFPLRPRMQQITLEVILRAVFGVQERARMDAFHDVIPKLLDRASSPIYAIRPLRRTLGRAGFMARLMALRTRLDALIYEEIVDRRDDPDAEAREDVLSLLMAAEFEEGGRMSARELRDELVTLLAAGHETTATGLAWAFELLFRHPRVRERLEAELRDGGTEYLDAVIEETLRLHPPVVDFIRRVREPVELGGYTVPAGEYLSTSTWLVNTNPDEHSEPLEFRPERYLGGERPGTYNWVPFGGGVRRCLGAAFAQYEMRVVLCEVLTAAPQLRAASERPEVAVLRNVTAAPNRGVPAVLDG